MYQDLLYKKQEFHILDDMITIKLVNNDEYKLKRSGKVPYTKLKTLIFMVFFHFPDVTIQKC